LLTTKRLQFIINKCHRDLYISSRLINRIIKEDNVDLFSIIFDREFIVNTLIFHYKNKTPISNSNLIKQISKHKFLKQEIHSGSKRLVHCRINESRQNWRDVTTLLFCACINGNETIVKYLVQKGVDVNKENGRGETPLFLACEKGNEQIVKYLVEHGANINKENVIFLLFLLLFF